MRTLVLAAALALAAVGCGGGDESGDAVSPAAPTVADAAASDPIAGETLDGERLSLADFRGRYLFVNVWSSW
jgi:hypothetical protein